MTSTKRPGGSLLSAGIEGPKAFARVFHEVAPRVQALFEATDDLRSFSGDLFRVDPTAWQPARYICGPPISQEDLWTLVGETKFKTVPPLLADETAEAIRPVIDGIRFPWLVQGRSASSAERDAAILSTASLWATQQLQTERRGTASRGQELATAEALEQVGLKLDPARNEIHLLDELARGRYSRERRITGSKCDVPTRLHDGRLLALECKVSNGPKNGWKRVNRETAGKARGWNQSFGVQVITGVVLAGVFDLACVRSAQEAGVAIFWQHDLDPLKRFVAAAQ